MDSPSNLDYSSITQRLHTIDQLASTSAAVRIAALNGLELLGKHDSGLHQTILDDVCGYLRVPYSLVEDPAGVERQVRRTAQKILRRHLRPEMPGYWRHNRIDLSGATLDDFDLTQCVLNEANFDGATFVGFTQFNNTSFATSANFGHCVFQGKTFFSNSKFVSTVMFDSTIFKNDAYFHGAKFSDAMLFCHVTAEEGIHFSNASFASDTYFTSGIFNGIVKFDKCHFHERAVFEYSVFRGEANYRQAIFDASGDFDNTVFGVVGDFMDAKLNESLTFADSAGQRNGLLPIGETCVKPRITFKSASIQVARDASDASIRAASLIGNDGKQSTPFAVYSRDTGVTKIEK